MIFDKIYKGDNAELIKDVPDESVDLTVTSPPYDNLRKYKGFSFDFEILANELFRVTKQGGVLVWKRRGLGVRSFCRKRNDSQNGEKEQQTLFRF